MEVLKLVFKKMRNYDDLPIRPYYGDATPSLLKELAEVTNDGLSITPSALAGVAGRMIRPVSDTGGVVAQIANGWGEQRLMFSMEVLARTGNRSRSIHVISGYTNYDGSQDRLGDVLIDEDMELYFNSITRVEAELTDQGPRGSSWLTSVSRSNQILQRQSKVNLTGSRGHAGTITMRPEDVCQRGASNRIFEQAARQSNVDMRGGFAEALKFSSRLNSTADRYLSRQLTSLLASNESTEGVLDHYQHERDVSTIFKDARGKLREDALSGDPVLDEMSQDTRIFRDGYITYGELMSMCPDFDWDNVQVHYDGGLMKRGARGDFSSWNGNSNEVVAATMLNNALAMYLINHQLEHIEFSANNIGSMGEMVMVVSNATAVFGGATLRQVINLLRNRMETEILRDMLPWPDCRMDLDVEVDVDGDCFIKISLDGDHWEEFLFPTFCDAVISPVITENTDDLDGMKVTLSKTVDHLGSRDIDERDGDYSAGGIYTGRDRPSSNRRPY